MFSLDVPDLVAMAQKAEDLIDKIAGTPAADAVNVAIIILIGATLLFVVYDAVHQFGGES